MDREEFIDEVELTFNMHGVDVRNSVYNAIERALGEQNDDAEICRDGNGNPSTTVTYANAKRVPLDGSTGVLRRGGCAASGERAINESKKYHDDEDGELGVVGYEINFDR